MYVTATKQKGNPDIVRGVGFVVSAKWNPVQSDSKLPFSSKLLFTLNFSAN